MHILLPVAALGLVLAGCASAVGPQPVVTVVTAAPLVTTPTVDGEEQAMAEARQYVYRVRNSVCLATGTAFALNSSVVTNRHVAAGAHSVDLATWDGRDFRAGVRGHDPHADLALLVPSSASDERGPAVAAGDPSTGSAVFVTGYPDGDQLTVSSGTVLALTTTPDLGVSGPVLVLSAKVQPGNSGSPVLDGAGRLVGVVFAEDTASGDALAMPLSTLQAFLASGPAGSTPACPS